MNLESHLSPHVKLLSTEPKILGNENNDYISFYNSGSEKVRITGAGNVGIGTASPGALSDRIKLQVEGGIAFGDSTTQTSTHLVAQGPNFVFNKGDASGGFYFRKNTVSGDPDVYTELVHISNDGNVGIGTTNPGQKLDVSGNIRASGELQSTAPYALRQVYGNYGFMHYQDGANYYMLITNSGDQYGPYNSLRPFYIDLSNGTVTMQHNMYAPIMFDINDASYYVDPNGTTSMNISYASAYYHHSDERLKRNIKAIPNALEMVSRLRGVTFDWKRDGKPGAGVIAQEVEAILPSAVSELKKGEKSVDYGQLIAPLIEAVKELKSRNEALEAKFEAYRAAHP